MFLMFFVVVFMFFCLVDFLFHICFDLKINQIGGCYFDGIIIIVFVFYSRVYFLFHLAFLQ